MDASGVPEGAEGQNGEDGELAVTQEALAGTGDLWLPNRGENNTYVNFCFTDLQGASSYRNSVIDGLRGSWGRYANVIFDDRGSCDSQPFGWVGIRVDPNFRDSPTGTSAAIVGFDATRHNPAVWLPMLPGQPGNQCGLLGLVDPGECIRRSAIHEFGHVLGFKHESLRSDRPPNAPCPTGHPAVADATFNIPPNTIITDYDPNSIMEAGNCQLLSNLTNLSANDIAGVKAIYGAGSVQAPCPSNGCLNVKYASFSTEMRQYAIRFQINARWINTDSSAHVSSQTYIGQWERVRFLPASGVIPSDGLIRYGDVVTIFDSFGRYLSSNSSRVVSTAASAGASEKWIVETRDGALQPFGTPVFVNAPLRLVSQAFGYRLTMSGSTVTTTTATSSSELRINGPLVIK